MNARRIRTSIALLAALCGCVSDPVISPSDAPEHIDRVVASNTAYSYQHALQRWTTAEDISAWLAANFSYDDERAVRLSETQRMQNRSPAIFTPAELFDKKSGICVDLARFAVETLQRIDLASDPSYVMIEFEPIEISGHTLRLHWLAKFKRDGQWYFFADSKRPGHIAGPYPDTRAFVEDYERYRRRTIVAFKELPSFRKQQQTRALTQSVQ